MSCFSMRDVECRVFLSFSESAFFTEDIKKNLQKTGPLQKNIFDPQEVDFFLKASAV